MSFEPQNFRLPFVYNVSQPFSMLFFGPLRLLLVWTNPFLTIRWVTKAYR